MIILTGASDGLGRAVAELFVSEGIKVLGLCRGEVPTGVEHINTDLADTSSLQQAIKKVLSIKEPISAVINCAGVISIEPFNSITSEALDYVYNVNVRAPMLLTSGLFERIKKDGADILNVSSTVGLKGISDQEAYASSKWALRGLSASLQVDLKDSPCRVISFCPGGMKTNLFLKATGKTGTEKGNWMDPKDVAKVLKQVLDLPKSMEVSEIVINRK